MQKWLNNQGFINEKMHIQIEHNFTPFCFLDRGNRLEIYEKSYIVKELPDHELPDSSRALATIECDIFSEERPDLGLARLTVYSENSDFELFLFFALSTFLLYKARLDDIHAHQA